MESGTERSRTPRRSAPEATALLVELGRAVKGREFYAPSDAQQQQVLTRAVRVWQGELARAGAFEIEAASAGIRIPELGHKVPSVHLGSLVEKLLGRGIRSLRFEADFDPEGFAALVELLADASLGEGEAVESAVYARVPHGLVVNRTAPAAVAPPPRPAPPPPAPVPEVAIARPPEPDTEPELEIVPPREPVPEEETEPQLEAAMPLLREAPAEEEGPEAGTSDAFDFEGSGSGGTLEPPPPPTPETAPPPPPHRDPSVALGPDGYEEELELDFEVSAPLEMDRGERAPTPAQASRDITDTSDTDALEARSHTPDTDTDVTVGPDGRASQLRQLLGELDDCDDDIAYNDLARRVAVLAETLSDEGHGDLGYRALFVLTAHARDEKDHSVRQRQLAQEHLETLSRGSRVDELIERSCAADSQRSLEATQLLLRIGKPVVAPLLRAADRERDPNRRSELQGILIAMGETLLPDLLDAMSSEEVSRVRSAIRLAGESQNPGTVTRLEQFLLDGPPALRQEAAKALVRIGDARSVETLSRALEHPEGDVPSLAAYCLGATRSGRAVEALLGALERALADQTFEFAAEAIRSLGRIGRPEATRALSELLLHRGMRHRKQYRELKLAAAAALGRIPGDAAAGALAQAARGRDAQVRRAAQTALDRRTRSLSA